MGDEKELWWIDSVAEPDHGFQVGAAVLSNVHPKDVCAGHNCVIHNPSDHHMVDWPLNWRGDRRIMERMCPHGIGHPDPDDIAFHKSRGEGWQGVHGCDLCC